MDSQTVKVADAERLAEVRELREAAQALTVRLDALMARLGFRSHQAAG